MKTLSCGDYRLNLVEYPKGYNRVLPFRTDVKQFCWKNYLLWLETQET